MKTLLISGDGAPVPEKLRGVIARGSTSVDERPAGLIDPSVSLSGLDRIVFWAPGDPSIRSLAARYAVLERTEGKEVVVYVTTSPDEGVPELSPDEIYVWPQDEDKLTMAFMTGA